MHVVFLKDPSALELLAVAQGGATGGWVCGLSPKGKAALLSGRQRLWVAGSVQGVWGELRMRFWSRGAQPRPTPPPRIPPIPLQHPRGVPENRACKLSRHPPP